MTKEKKRFSKVLSVLLSAMLPFQLAPMQFGLTAAAEGEELVAAAQGSQPYVDENGEDCSVSGYTTVTDKMTTWDSGWYVVNDDVTFTERIQVSGNVHLILVGTAGNQPADRSTLKAEKGIHVPQGKSLTIYSDFVDTDNPYMMGELIAYGVDGYGAAIGGNDEKVGGSITINGGCIHTNSYQEFTGSAFIGGGSCSANDGGYAESIVINNGFVGDASHVGTVNGAAIGYGSNAKDPNHVASIQINGGVINAKSSTAAGIGSGAGCTESPKIEINGGRIHAWGGNNAAAIGGSNGYSKNSYITLAKKMYIKNPSNGGLHVLEGTNYQYIGSFNTPATEVEMEPAYTLSFAEGTPQEAIDYFYFEIGNTWHSAKEENIPFFAGQNVRLHISTTTYGTDGISPYYRKAEYSVKTASGEIAIQPHWDGAEEVYNQFTMPAADVVVSVNDLVGVNYKVTIDETTHGKVTSNADDIHHWIPYGKPVQLTVTPEENCILKSLTVTDKSGNEVANGSYTFTMPASNITVNAQFSYHPDGVKYIDPIKNYSEETVPDGYTTVESDTTSWTGGWYVVNDDVTVAERIQVSGDVKLVLLDGKKLTAKQGIHVPADSTLTIYSQSIDLSSENGMGQLNA